MSWTTLGLSALCVLTLQLSSARAGGICPMGCYCDETVVDCSTLMTFPMDLLSDTTVFKVSHLNVLEIPSYAFRYLNNITRVEFINCNIANVAPFAFYETPSLKELIFDRTVIGNLESYSFNELQNVTKIQFSKARIGRIKPFAFYKLHNLGKMSITTTHIRNFYTHSFYECSHIGSLFIKSSNISDFVTGAFVKLTDINQVTVEDNAFWNMHCDVLDSMIALSDNFYFIQNTFYCNCSLSWLFSETYSHLGGYRGVSMCHGPDMMENVTLSNVVVDDLGCKGRPPPTTVKCQQHDLKPRPRVPTPGGDGTEQDPGDTASTTHGASLIHVLLMVFLACHCFQFKR